MTPTTTGADRTRGPLLILTALFLVPLALAFLMYYGTGWRPGFTKTTSVTTRSPKRERGHGRSRT